VSDEEVPGLEGVWGREGKAPGLFTLGVRQPWVKRFTLQLLYFRGIMPVLIRQEHV